ncbi:MAG: hypothetical protein A2V66_03510 [Ignavibacteria bacterium RBG_13_36_8]|nr:MAG: hypothetical protein A2V66_03510 [Ignavibacteria bacterium RBG_13_36_8]
MSEVSQEIFLVLFGTIAIGLLGFLGFVSLFLRFMKSKFILDHMNNYDNDKLILLQPLTPTEKKIASLLSKGNENKEISAQLNMGLKNVNKYVGNILRKTNAKNRGVFIALANKNGSF